MPNSALDLFGQLLMTNVRDESISDWKMIVDGRMKGNRALALRHKLTSFSEDQRKAFLSLVPEVVDSVLHHLLFTFEQHNQLTLGIQTSNNKNENLRELSDGLAGELYSDAGWIARFSKEKNM